MSFPLLRDAWSHPLASPSLALCLESTVQVYFLLFSRLNSSSLTSRPFTAGAALFSPLSSLSVSSRVDTIFIATAAAAHTRLSYCHQQKRNPFFVNARLSLSLTSWWPFVRLFPRAHVRSFVSRLSQVSARERHTPNECTPPPLSNECDTTDTRKRKQKEKDEWFTQILLWDVHQWHCNCTLSLSLTPFSLCRAWDDLSHHFSPPVHILHCAPVCRATLTLSFFFLASLLLKHWQNK